MSKHKQGFIITPEGRVSLWIELSKRTVDGFYFWVINGSWKGRWADTGDLLTNGVFKVSEWRSRDEWQQATFRHTPPAAPEFAHYNDAIHWMQQYIDGGK